MSYQDFDFDEDDVIVKDVDDLIFEMKYKFSVIEKLIDKLRNLLRQTLISDGVISTKYIYLSNMLDEYEQEKNDIAGLIFDIERDYQLHLQEIRDIENPEILRLKKFSENFLNEYDIIDILKDLDKLIIEIRTLLE